MRIPPHNTVGALRKALEKLPDDTPVITPGGDHSYYLTSGHATTALVNRNGEWTEDYGEEDTPEAEFGKRVKVFVVAGG